MSFAGRREGLECWVWWAALRAFFALDRDVVGLRVGDGFAVEEDESLSSAKEVSAAGGRWSEIISLLDSGNEHGSMLAKAESGSSKSVGEAMAQWRAIGLLEAIFTGARLVLRSECYAECSLMEI